MKLVRATITRVLKDRVCLSTFRVQAVSSRSGFQNYEEERRNFQHYVPQNYNFMKHHFGEWARKTPNAVALWWKDDNGNELKWSFHQLDELSQRAANTLIHGCGLKSGDRLLLILPRVPEWYIIKLACIRTGIVVCPGTSMLTRKDIQSRLQASHAAGIVVMNDKIDDINRIESNLNKEIKKISVSDNFALSGGIPESWFDFNYMIKQGSAQHQCTDNSYNDAMLIYFTSGTTGNPKMTLHSHASYAGAHEVIGRYWYDLTSNDVLWSNSDTGWAKSGWATIAPWIQGATVFIHHTQGFDPEKTLHLLQSTDITTFCSAPTTYRYLVQHNLSTFSNKALQHCVSAAEPLNPEVNEKWYTGTGLEIYEGFGQTETTCVACTFPCIKRKPGSIGKATPGYTVEIVDDSGIPVSAHTEGNLALKVHPVRPVGLFHGYVDDPERTAKSFVGDYYLTGDRAYMDEEGYLWFVGRADDVILSAGYRIGPFEVESALQEHPLVVESAVVASPDPHRGQIVKAFVILKEDGKKYNPELLKQELQNHVKSTTAPYKYPRQIEFVNNLPKTVSGKTRRVELREKEYQYY